MLMTYDIDSKAVNRNILASTFMFQYQFLEFFFQNFQGNCHKILLLRGLRIIERDHCGMVGLIPHRRIIQSLFSNTTLSLFLLLAIASRRCQLFSFCCFGQTWGQTQLEFKLYVTFRKFGKTLDSFWRFVNIYSL